MYMLSKNSWGARRFCFFAFGVLRQPLEIRKKNSFEMLKRKQRSFVEMVFEMRREEAETLHKTRSRAKGGSLEGEEDEEDILSWKDEEGEGPLLALSHVRGRTEKLALFLLREGADPWEKKRSRRDP
jgi:hypothetical protein